MTTNTQLTRYLEVHKRHFGVPPTGRILEFGCGRGEFMRAAVDHGLDCYGVENEPVRHQSFLADAAGNQDHLARFQLYDGDIVPFDDDYFDHVYSWFVLEHVPDVMQSIREIVRVTRPGGTFLLYSQEAANGYDGHCDIPWPPFLPRKFYRPYLDELGFDDNQITFMETSTFFITGAQVVAGLQVLGCEVLYLSPPEPMRALAGLEQGLKISSDETARSVAREVATLTESGGWKRPKENMIIAARRMQ